MGVRSPVRSAVRTPGQASRGRGLPWSIPVTVGNGSVTYNGVPVTYNGEYLRYTGG